MGHYDECESRHKGDCDNSQNCKHKGETGLGWQDYGHAHHSHANLKGRKFDGGKPRWGLVPKAQMEQVVDVLTMGSIKYEDDNWKRVDGAETRYYDALERHIADYQKAIQDGNEDGKIDPESGKSHLAHAICNCLFLMWLDDNKKKPEKPVMADGYSYAEVNVPMPVSPVAGGGLMA